MNIVGVSAKKSIIMMISVKILGARHHPSIGIGVSAIRSIIMINVKRSTIIMMSGKNFTVDVDEAYSLVSFPSYTGFFHGSNTVFFIDQFSVYCLLL